MEAHMNPYSIFVCCVLAGLAMSPGCGGSKDAQPANPGGGASVASSDGLPTGTPLQSLGGKAPNQSIKSATLCELVKNATQSGSFGIGLYTLASAVGVEEAEIGPASGKSTYSYAAFDLIEPWTAGASKHVVSKLGGCWAGMTCAISVKVGQTAVLFWGAVSPTIGYPVLGTGQAFWTERPTGGWSNGVLYTHKDISSADLKIAVQQLAAGLAANGKCPFDVGAHDDDPPPAAKSPDPVEPTPGPTAFCGDACAAPDAGSATTAAPSEQTTTDTTP